LGAARYRHRCSVHHKGRKHLTIPMLPGVEIQHEIDQCPFQLAPRSRYSVNRAPVIFAPDLNPGSQSSPNPNEVWVQIEFRDVTHRLISTLSDESFPTGTEAWGRFGT